MVRTFIYSLFKQVYKSVGKLTSDLGALGIAKVVISLLGCKDVPLSLTLFPYLIGNIREAI